MSQKILQNALQQRSKSDADWNGHAHLLSNTLSMIKAPCRVFFLNKGSMSALKSVYDCMLARSRTHINTQPCLLEQLFRNL